MATSIFKDVPIMSWSCGQLGKGFRVYRWCKLFSIWQVLKLSSKMPHTRCHTCLERENKESHKSCLPREKQWKPRKGAELLTTLVRSNERTFWSKWMHSHLLYSVYICFIPDSFNGVLKLPCKVVLLLLLHELMFWPSSLRLLELDSHNHSLKEILLPLRENCD